MFSYDDDENGELLSSRKALERADHGKADKKEQKIKKEKGDLLKLRSQVQLQKLKAGQPAQKNDVKAVTFTTKTREEQLKAQIQHASQVDTPDSMVEDGKRLQALRDEVQIEEQKQDAD